MCIVIMCKWNSPVNYEGTSSEAALMTILAHFPLHSQSEFSLVKFTSDKGCWEMLGILKIHAWTMKCVLCNTNILDAFNLLQFLLLLFFTIWHCGIYLLLFHFIFLYIYIYRRGKKNKTDEEEGKEKKFLSRIFTISAHDIKSSFRKLILLKLLQKFMS